MVESGLFQKMQRKWFNPVQYCSPEEVKVHQLGLDKLAGLFIVYGSISLAAVLARLLQFCLIRCYRCSGMSKAEHG